MDVIHDVDSGASLARYWRNRIAHADRPVGGRGDNQVTLLKSISRIRAVALLVVLLVATPLFARTKTDVLVMNNGDRLTCEIKGLDSGALHASFDYIAGTVSIDWAKINHIESTQSFIVKFEDGSVYTGTINTTENAAGHRPMEIRVSETPEESVVVTQPQLVQFTQTSDTFWKRLNGNINSGTSYSKGNEAFQYQLSASVQYPRERWSAGAAFGSTLSSNTGTTAATRNSLTLDAQRSFRWNNWFYTGLVSFLQSSTQDIQLQSNFGGGVGRYLKNTNRARIAVYGGMAYQTTRYTQVFEEQAAAQNVATAMVGTNITVFKFDKTKLTVTANALPAISELGRVYFNTNASYFWKLGHNITWNISFYGNWDNKPPPHFSGSDYGSSSGIGWTFGNK